MKLGIISDTHDRLESLAKAIEIFKKEKVEMIVHCGDWVSPFTIEFFDKYCQKVGLKVPVRSLIGNNKGDLERLFERNGKLLNPIQFSSKATMELNIQGKKIVAYHGDDKNILLSLITSKLYDVVLTGHTHHPRNEMIGKTLIINPGTTCFAAKSQIIPEASITIYESEKQKLKFIAFT